MSPELEELLLGCFPDLYSAPRIGNFACGDGWFDLLFELSEKLEGTGVHCLQVKEKLGTLRFYLDRHSARALRAVLHAEFRSANECELCGQEAEVLDIRGWLRTLCPPCGEGERFAAEVRRQGFIRAMQEADI